MAGVLEISSDILVHGDNRAQDTIDDTDLSRLFTKAQNSLKDKRK